MKRYYRRHKGYAWTFHEAEGNSSGKMESRYLMRASSTRIVPHIKIKGDANPYDSAWTDYFINRSLQKRDHNQDGRFVEEHG